MQHAPSAEGVRFGLGGPVVSASEPLRVEGTTSASATSSGLGRSRAWAITSVALVAGSAVARGTAVLLGPWPDLLSDEAAALGSLGWYVEALKTPFPLLAWGLVYVLTKRFLMREPILK